jgi:hypothetical protein
MKILRKSLVTGSLVLAPLFGVSALAAGDKGEKSDKQTQSDVESSDAKSAKSSGAKSTDMKSGEQAKGDAKAFIDEHLADWPKASKDAFTSVYDKHGEPDGITDDMLLWEDTAPFKQTIVYRESVKHNFPSPHEDVLAQVIDYRVPIDKFDDLARFDGSVLIDRTKGEVAVRCDSEEANLVTLNLVDDIVAGDKSVQEARDYLARAMNDLNKRDKLDRYMERLQIDKKLAASAGDPDRAASTAQATRPERDEEER